MENLQLTKKLKAACIAIYSIVLLMLVVFIVNTVVIQQRGSSASLVKNSEDITPTSATINVYGNNNIIYNDTFYVYNGTINRYVVNPDYGTWAANIMTATREWSNGLFTMEDAINLVSKITDAAVAHGLDSKIAFAIVDIESDFRNDAYNKKGSAYGLCQITQPCLNEYNNNHPNATYTINDMYDVDSNLEVGFWYYKWILTHYNDYYDYITTDNDYTKLRDAYIAYNYGVTNFNYVGREGRNKLRNGIYPNIKGTKANNYGAKAGDPYTPMSRFNEKVKTWNLI